MTRESACTWVGQRIVMLRGYHADSDRARTAVGINIVAPVLRVEGNRVWVGSTGEDDSGWLSDAFQTGGPVGIWAWNSDQVTIQF
jgi:hypothetical protein